MVCPPFRGSCLPCLFPFVGSRVCLPKVLSPDVVFHCLPSPFLFSFLGWCARLLGVLSPLVSYCLPSSLSLCPVVSNCLPLSPIVSRHVCLCWLVHFPKSCFSLSPIVSLDMCAACLCWMVCPPSRCLVSPRVPTCVPVLDGASALDDVSALRGLVSPCLPVLDGASAFPRFWLPCLLACLPACLPSCLPACFPTSLSSCFSLWRVV